MSLFMPMFLCLVVMHAVSCQQQQPQQPQPQSHLTPAKLLNPTLRPEWFYPWCGQFLTFWSRWSDCSKKCGFGGTQIRTRKCLSVSEPCKDPHHQPSYHHVSYFNPFAPKPKPVLWWYIEGCKGRLKEVRKCFKKLCCDDVDGEWNHWGCWSDCIRGVRFRHRVCNKKRPQGFGKFCPGIGFQKSCCIDGKDIIFSIDGSGSIGSFIFNAVKTAVVSTINMLDLDTGNGPPSKVRVGIQIFNHNAYAAKHLDDFSTPNIDFPNGGTDIPGAVRHVDDVMLGNPSNGNRETSKIHPNCLVLITDGWGVQALPPTDNIDRIIVIGVGQNINPAMVHWATSPFFFLHATSNCQIADFLKSRLLCEPTVQVTTYPCYSLKQPYGLRALQNNTSSM